MHVTHARERSHAHFVCSAIAHMPQPCAAIKHPEEDGNVGLPCSYLTVINDLLSGMYKMVL